MQTLKLGSRQSFCHDGDMDGDGVDWPYLRWLMVKSYGSLYSVGGGGHFFRRALRGTAMISCGGAVMAAYTRMRDIHCPNKHECKKRQRETSVVVRDTWGERVLGPDLACFLGAQVRSNFLIARNSRGQLGQRGDAVGRRDRISAARSYTNTYALDGTRGCGGMRWDAVGRGGTRGMRGMRRNAVGKYSNGPVTDVRFGGSPRGNRQ